MPIEIWFLLLFQKEHFLSINLVKYCKSLSVTIFCEFILLTHTTLPNELTLI